jgi:hypothetical protein
VDHRLCVVVDGANRWPGTVLAWQRSATGWRGLVEFGRTIEQGWQRTSYQSMSADVLEPA